MSRVFFFFQAEDGIRYKLVTGVQTCALPISAEGLPQVTRLQGDPVLARAGQWTIPLRTQPRSMANPTRPRGMKRATRTMKRPYVIRCAVGKLTQVSSWAA